MTDPDGRTHYAQCWRGHEDCAERLLSEAAEALDAVLDELQRSTDPRPSTWPAIAKAERDVLVRLRAALDE